MHELKVWRRTCRNRFFELQAAQAIKSKAIYGPTYLSVGQEHIPAIVAEFCPDWLIFPQHRCHSWYLTYTDDEEGLANELLGREDGCNQGRGGSASVSSKKHNFFGHSGLLGDQVPIAVGAAHASNKPTVCVLGDAAAEEDYCLGALGYAATKKAPVLFIVEDNDRSILTPKAVRRSWNIVDVAISLNMFSVCVNDNPMDIACALEHSIVQLPALINISVERHLWHAGAGSDGEPKTNTFEEYRAHLNSKHNNYAECLVKYEQDRMEALWQRLLKQ